MPFIAGAEGFWQAPDMCEGVDCNACDLIKMANLILDWLIGIMFIIFGFLVIVAGFELVTSGGNPGQKESAKKKLFNGLIGIVIVLAAWLIIDDLMKTIAGKEFNNGGPWHEIKCESNLDPDEPVSSITSIEVTFEDSNAVGPDSIGTYDAGLVNESCNPSTPNFPACANVSTNGNMNPIFDCEDGDCSHMVHSDAEAHMAATLAGPYAALQNSFSGTVVINDAIAKDGTSRETQTTGSRHFHGDALDLSTAGMSNAQKLELFNKAKAAGFTGFGFGNNILHVDTGAKRAWDYGNSTYGGQSVEQLKAQARS